MTKKIWIFFLFIGVCAPQARSGDRGTVVVVYDGDTVKVRFEDGGERRVRLIGIDSAEIGETPISAPLEALLSKRFTFHHLFRQQVELTYERVKEDKYGRLLAYVWREGVLFNEYILERGFARVYLKFSFAMKNRFIRAQKEAQEKGRGFWNKKADPVIRAKQAKDHIGELTRVSFVCHRIRKSGRLLFFQTENRDFAAVIQEDYRSLFGDILKLKGKTIEIFGYLEEYRGQPQIVLFSPSQIGVVK